jgi:membrane protein implicated in regulation of membrane protease activity
MKLPRVIFIIAAVIVGVWVLGLLVRLVGWVFESLLYIAAIIVIIGVLRYWWEKRKSPQSDRERNAVDEEIVDNKSK